MLVVESFCSEIHYLLQIYSKVLYAQQLLLATILLVANMLRNSLSSIVLVLVYLSHMLENMFHLVSFLFE